jgi:hypothetical protein
VHELRVGVEEGAHARGIAGGGGGVDRVIGVCGPEAHAAGLVLFEEARDRVVTAIRCHGDQIVAERQDSRVGTRVSPRGTASDRARAEGEARARRRWRRRTSRPRCRILGSLTARAEARIRGRPA